MHTRKGGKLRGRTQHNPQYHNHCDTHLHGTCRETTPCLEKLTVTTGWLFHAAPSMNGTGAFIIRICVPTGWVNTVYSVSDTMRWMTSMPCVTCGHAQEALQMSMTAIGSVHKECSLGNRIQPQSKGAARDQESCSSAESVFIHISALQRVSTHLSTSLLVLMKKQGAEIRCLTFLFMCKRNCLPKRHAKEQAHMRTSPQTR